MKITSIFYPPSRKEWRQWLKKNHLAKKEIWLIYYKKHSSKPRIPYNDAVEEALCFGWIDSTVKTVDKDSFAQRFSPRNPKSGWSELNKERARKLLREGKMTIAGKKLLPEDVLHPTKKVAHTPKLVIPKFIETALKKEKAAWQNFKKYPESYRRLKVGWIALTLRPDTRKQRLRHLVKMCAKNKMYGTVVS